MNTSKSGFTLIELLVVIAIIGILSSVVITSLFAVRAKAKEAAVQKVMANIVPAAILCGSSGSDLHEPVGNVGNKICDTEPGLWPTLSDGWMYDEVTDDVDLDASTGSFSFNASSGGKKIVCTETGCLKASS